MRGAVVLTASAGSFPGLIDVLRALPVTVEERPLMRFAPPHDWTPLDTALDGAASGVIAFTSPRAAQAFADRRRERGGRVSPAGMALDIWAAGAGTVRALGDTVREVRTPDEAEVGRRGAAIALAQAMIDAGVKGPVLFPCGDHRRDELPARLRDAGIAVDEVVCYRSVLASDAEAREAAAHARVLVVASPSVAELLARVCPPDIRPALLAVGPTTAAASHALGWPAAAIADQPNIEAIGAAARTLLL